MTLITQNASGIAHHAGASVGALYHFFPSKENPLVSCSVVDGSQAPLSPASHAIPSKIACSFIPRAAFSIVACATRPAR
ncbi:TetR/AcrR family transcriptional regulator [Burkholderia ubonensis]|uniref:TetR family transcriptional regulator n=1 Tax=Burkholderia ubonensis TaxID=101571 RepID=UPI0009B30CCB